MWVTPRLRRRGPRPPRRLAEELHPGPLDARVVLRRLGEGEECLKILVEARSQRGVDDVVALESLVGYWALSDSVDS